MVRFDCPGDNAARDSVLAELSKLSSEACKHLNVCVD